MVSDPPLQELSAHRQLCSRVSISQSSGLSRTTCPMASAVEAALPWISAFASSLSPEPWLLLGSVASRSPLV